MKSQYLQTVRILRNRVTTMGGMERSHIVGTQIWLRQADSSLLYKKRSREHQPGCGPMTTLIPFKGYCVSQLCTMLDCPTVTGASRKVELTACHLCFYKMSLSTYFTIYQRLLSNLHGSYQSLIFHHIPPDKLIPTSHIL